MTGAVIGERWRIGTALLAVTQPRLPCAKLGLRFGDPGMPTRFAAEGRPGAYLRVVEEGLLAAGDSLSVEARPRHGVTVGMAFRAYFADRKRARRLLDAPELPPVWRAWAASVAS